MFSNTFFRRTSYFIFFLTVLVSCKEADYEVQELVETEKVDSLPVVSERPLVLETIIGDFEQSLIDQGLVNLQQVDSTILVDLKYSTQDNFFKEDVYQDLENAYLPIEVAQMLLSANSQLQAKFPDYRLLVFDAVRPHNIQRILWEALDSLPVNLRKAYVADPDLGSLHNYGCAVDLSIYDLRKDTLLDMGTKYDYFGYLAYPRKEAEMLEKDMLKSYHISNRNLLRRVMQSAGFRTIRSEWWHFNSTTLTEAKEKFLLIE